MKTSFTKTTQKEGGYIDMETDVSCITDAVLLDDKAFWRIEDCPKYIMLELPKMNCAGSSNRYDQGQRRKDLVRFVHI